ncbi:glycosyltransferase family 2 protein [Cellulomonas sp. NPDC055163]
MTVAVATFRRPVTLASTLSRVVPQAEALASEVRVLVVDNDPDASARDLVVGDWAGRVEYRHEPRPGLAAVRNRALDESAASDVLVFVDDDELPRDGWLAHLVDAWSQWGCAAVAGPAVKRLAEPVDPWVRASAFFAPRATRVTGAVVPGAATNNLLLDLRVLRRLGLRFDERFGTSGGEDTMLTRMLGARGETVRWCAEAVVDDPVPADRATRAWVLRRSYRTGTTWSRVHLALQPSLPGRARARLSLVTRGAALGALGAAQALTGTLTRSLVRRARGEVRAASGWGVLAGVAGRTYGEYARAAAPGGAAGGGSAAGGSVRSSASPSAATSAGADA